MGYIRFAFPWKEEGSDLAKYDLDTWQSELFTHIGKAQEERPEDSLQYAISSGH